ncbi:hypothetical protein [Streptosporangium sp. NPDC049376]|uniref:hypothetical protein n=1 Tax=Streptosporangium sp. NPDC049376 TaxID=3366192 RepID=UPI003797C599
MGKKVDFAVYRTNPHARFTMAYTCSCGQPTIGYSDDLKGLYTGECANGHISTVMAS